MANNVLIDTGGLSGGSAITQVHGTNIIAIDNTMVTTGFATPPTNVLFSSYGMPCTLTNNVIMGWSTICNNTSGLTGDHNATDMSSITGTTNALTSLTYANQFRDITTVSHDFRIAASGSSIATGSIANAETVDVFNQTRGPTDYSYGAQQFVTGQVISNAQYAQWPIITWFE